MDGAITRAEHEAFSDLMKAENKRLEEENNRQNKRLELLENNMQQIITQQLTTLTATIERLNLSVPEPGNANLFFCAGKRHSLTMKNSSHFILHMQRILRSTDFLPTVIFL